jgi:hypothetical protein
MSDDPDPALNIQHPTYKAQLSLEINSPIPHFTNSKEKLVE